MWFIPRMQSFFTSVGYHVIRVKEPHRITSIDAENQHPFVIRTIDKLEMKGNFVSMIEGIYEKPTANILHKTLDII